MLQFLFDTDHLTLFDQGHPLLRQRHASRPTDEVGVSAVTVQEVMKGRLAVLSRPAGGRSQVQDYALLLSSVRLLQRFPLVAYDRVCESQLQQLRALRLRVGTQDLKIAATALANNLTLLTRNRRDFARIPGIVLDDWSV